MGLLEIASPSSIENVSEGQCYYTIYFKPNNSYTIVRVPAGLYKRGRLLVDALHDAQRKQLRRIGTKHHTFSSTAGARSKIPTILCMVIEEVRPIVAPP